VIRVLIADDQVLFRQMIVETLREEEDIEVVGEATNGVEAVAQCETLRPDIVLLDINMPQMNGIEATRRLVRSHPETRVVILTAFDEDHFVFELISAGATGYVLKESHSDEVVRAIRAAQSGESMIEPRVLNKVLIETRRLMQREKAQAPREGTGLDLLTDREREVLREMGRGKNNREITEALFISESTVKTHVTNVMQKMRFRDRVEAVLFAVQNGLV